MATQKKTLLHPYVERKKGVCGGRPVIKETRFPVSSIVIPYQRGLSAEEILQEFPQLTPTQVYGALAYYFDHQDEINTEIEDLRRKERQMNRDTALRLSLYGKSYPLSGP